MQAVAVSKDCREVVSLCGMPYHDHAHNLQKSRVQMKYQVSFSQIHCTRVSRSLSSGFILHSRSR